MIIRREIGEKGQVVIPKDIRELLKLRHGSKIIFEFSPSNIAITTGIVIDGIFNLETVEVVLISNNVSVIDGCWDFHLFW